MQIRQNEFWHGESQLTRMSNPKSEFSEKMATKSGFVLNPVKRNALVPDLRFILQDFWHLTSEPLRLYVNRLLSLCCGRFYFSRVVRDFDLHQTFWFELITKHFIFSHLFLDNYKMFIYRVIYFVNPIINT